MASSRRDFMRQLALLSASLAGGGLAACRRGPAGSTATPGTAGAAAAFVPPATRTFTGARRANLEAVCARLLPADEDPGALEAGCADFIDAQLGLPHFDLLRRGAERGLDHLDVLARKLGGGTFAASAPEVQDDLLRQLHQERRKGLNGAKVFGLFLTLTLEGFFGDPRYGGNRNQIGWRLAGHVPCWFHGAARGLHRG
jgi:gluconate 2-dehydrogenase gamma chain